MLESVKQEKTSHTISGRRFVSERELAPIVGREARTLQKDRLYGKGPFPFYRVGRQVLYDPDECVRIIEQTRFVGGQAA